MLIGDDGEVWNDYSGSNYQFFVNSNILPVSFVEGTYHWPLNGDIDSIDDLWINTESKPKGAGFGGKVVYSSDGGSNWNESVLSYNGTNATADLWHVNLGKFSPNTVIRYALMIEDEDGNETWDNNGGGDYFASVNAANSSIEWFGATRSTSVRPPVLNVNRW